MRSLTAAQFWKFYAALPRDIQRRANRAYVLWRTNPQAQGLYFKRVGTRLPVYSVRIGQSYRAVGILQNDAIVWFWIGPHDEYERILKGL
jgi:hypothetical protein